jgi:nicotinamidase-related amidase
MFEINNSCLVVIDVQGKLAELMHDQETLYKNVQILIKAAKILDIPILWCQQVPKALGPTIETVAELLADNQPIDKSSFSCCGNEQFSNKLKETNRNQVIICGIETHVCVYQTAIDLLQQNYHVSVIADAVSSRTAENKQLTLDKMLSLGIDISSTEMMLFELLKTAEHPNFREIAKLIK